MRVRSLLGRWILLALLALGVVCMHHAPLAHEHAHGFMATPMPPVVSAAHQASAGSGQHTADPGQATAVLTPLAPMAAGHDSAAGHEWLHMCLAILVAAATLLAYLVLRTMVLPAPGSTASAIRVGTERFPPPEPVPRRLAALCVLRL